MDLFDSVLSGSDLQRTNPTADGGMGHPIGRVIDKNAGIALFGSPKNSPAILLRFDIEGTLHELLHLAGQKLYFTDAQFAQIVNGIPQYAALARVPFPMDRADKKTRKELINNPGDIRWGGYWNDVLKRTCFE